MREHYSTSNTTGHWKRGLTGYGLSETAKGQCIKSSANRGHGASLIMDVGFFYLTHRLSDLMKSDTLHLTVQLVATSLH
jgi:hypothetical protein